MVRARTTAELLRELDAEAVDGSRAALVVSVAGSAVLIWSNDSQRTETLSRVLSEGGETIGLLLKADGGAETRVFCEYSEDPSAIAVLRSVRD
jgi:hypothetical protein